MYVSNTCINYVILYIVKRSTHYFIHPVLYILYKYLFMLCNSACANVFGMAWHDMACYAMLLLPCKPWSINDQFTNLI